MRIMDCRFIYITTRDSAEAKTIGRVLVEEKLAACVNIIDRMESIYWWEGKIEEGKEAVLIAKTTAEKVPALTAKVKELSSAECPCIIALPILEGNEDYLRWLQEGVV